MRIPHFVWKIEELRNWKMISIKKISPSGVRGPAQGSGN